MVVGDVVVVVVVVVGGGGGGRWECGVRSGNFDIISANLLFTLYTTPHAIALIPASRCSMVRSDWCAFDGVVLKMGR